MKISNVFIKRRQQLLQQIGNKGVAIVFATKQPRYHRETVYPYRQDRDFYYLTGYPESNAIAVFIPNRSDGEYILFNLEKNPEEEIWTGVRVGQLGACKDYGADQAFPVNMANDMVPELIKNRERIYFNIGDHEDHEQIMYWLQQIAGKERAGVNLPNDFINVGIMTHEMRLRKDDEEITLLRKAAEISAVAHVHVMEICKPGMMEYELEAEILHEYIRNGSRMPAFPPIVAGGANSCTLHYTQNDAELKSGELVLVDAGVDSEYYCGDITRTFPINGHFTAEQKAVYQAVLDTQLAVIEHVRPGVPWIELHRISERVITEKLVALRLLKGEVNELLEKQAFKPFYMHYIGHWLGLDAHDVGRYKIDDEWRLLEPGMVLTVEPGIYISSNITTVEQKWRNIGVRIEDDVLVTENGYEILTSGVPKTIDEIEKIMI
ncbi:MAG: Xaa-Pro aminopeptidase [Coxiella sp. DG_40]|nr:MAG: Xaa-Pro aminopeptidase [Coxiella sp. DG_40]